MKKRDSMQVPLLFVGIVLLIQVAGYFMTKSGLSTWYYALEQPKYTPPEAVFGPVWTFLYLVIIWVGSTLWVAPKNQDRNRGLLCWILQLVCNGLWSLIFFVFHQPLLAAIDLTLMVIFSSLTLYYTWKIYKPAAWGFSLYLVWILYALIINWSIVYLN